MTPPGVLDASEPTRRPHDPWSHRRGEPRTFAFLWALFLFAATLTIFGRSVSVGGLSHDIIRPAARTLLIVMAGALAILWPMVRLSQERDPKPRAGALQDAIVILVPIHAVVWPQGLYWLAHWPSRTIFAIVVCLTAWTFLIAALLAIAQTIPSSGPRRRIARAPLWMLAFILLALVPALLALLSPATPEPRPSWMLSPATAIAELTRAQLWSGQPTLTAPVHMLAIAATALLAALAWLGVWAITRLYSEPPAPTPLEPRTEPVPDLPSASPPSEQPPHQPA